MSAPVPEVDPGLVEVLAETLSWASGEFTRYDDAAHPDHNRWSWQRDGHGQAMRDDITEHAAHLARAVQGYVEGRVAAALEDAARRIDGRAATVNQWVQADLIPGQRLIQELRDAAQIVRSDARRSPETASTPDGGREGVRGGEGA